jgi:hypothetical protein
MGEIDHNETHDNIWKKLYELEERISKLEKKMLRK